MAWFFFEMNMMLFERNRISTPPFNNRLRFPYQYKMEKLILLVLMGGFTALNAQEVDTIINIKSFTVQGIRQDDSIQNQPSNPYLMDNKEVQNTAVQSTSDLLDNAVGIDVRSRSGLGVQSDLSIRGGTYDQSLLMIDGVKLSDPQTGHHMMNTPLFIDQVERVEQINNGGSRWFGPYAFSGAVNLVTKRADSNQLQLRLTGGEYGYLDAGISGSGVTKNTSTTVSLSRRQSPGYISNTDFEMNNLFISSNVDLKDMTFKFNGGITDKEFGAQNFYTANFPNQFEAIRTYFASLQTTLNFGKLKVTPRAYYRRHYDRFELFREGKNWYQQQGKYLVMESIQDTVPSWYSGPNYHRNEVRAGELNLAYSSKFGKTFIGGEYRHELVWSNNLGEPSDTVQDYGGAVYTKADSRENVSLFFEHNVRIKKIRISAGLLANVNSDYGSDVFPGADVSLELTKKMDLFAGANRNMRFPTYTDLYYNLGGAVGSIDLAPEQSQNYQLGLKYRNAWFSGSATGFYRQGRNLIDWVRINGSIVTEAANLTKVNFIGLETEGRINLKALYKSKDAFFNGLTLRYTGMSADQSSDGFESNYVLDYLKHKFFAGIDHSLTGRLNMAWNIKYQYREGGYFNGTTEVPFGGYALVDVRLYQQTRVAYWFIEVANLFNQQYEDIGFVQQPGRWLRAGIKYTIGFKS